MKVNRCDLEIFRNTYVLALECVEGVAWNGLRITVYTFRVVESGIDGSVVCTSSLFSLEERL